MPGIAIPFYLAHPRLARLEREQMLEVEGGTPSWCMRILRHEVGHAIDNAYMLRRRRRRQALFGSSSIEYPEFYTPKPYSRSFVLHIDNWYAQSHPDEDFAETFAVWLNPRSDWRRRYQDWPALKKLEYMDELMQRDRRRSRRWSRNAPPSIRCTASAARCGSTTSERPSTTRSTTRTSTIAICAGCFRSPPRTRARCRPRASSTASAGRCGGRSSAWTGVYQYTIDQVLEEMAERCDELQLRFAAGAEERTKADFIVVLTVQTMNYLHSGRHRVAL